MPYAKNFQGKYMKMQERAVYNEFKLNKAQKETVKKKAIKMRVVEIIFAVIAAALASTMCWFIFKIIGNFDTSSGGAIAKGIFSIIGLLILFLLSLTISVIPIIFFRRKAVKEKDILALAALTYSIKGKNALTTFENEINNQMKKEMESKKKKPTTAKPKKK